MSALHTPRRSKSFGRLQSMVAVKLASLSVLDAREVAACCRDTLNDLDQAASTDLTLTRAFLGMSHVILVGDVAPIRAQLARANIHEMPQTVHAWAQLVADERLVHAPQCYVALGDAHTHSFLSLCLRAKSIICADISPETEMVFESDDPHTLAHTHDLQQRFHLRTLNDWARAHRLLALDAPLCPHCGHETFSEPLLYCLHCGENPGTVRERANTLRDP